MHKLDEKFVITKVHAIIKTLSYTLHIKIFWSDNQSTYSVLVKGNKQTL